MMPSNGSTDATGSNARFSQPYGAAVTVQGTPIWPTRLTISFERSIRGVGPRWRVRRASAEASAELALLPGLLSGRGGHRPDGSIFVARPHPTAPSEDLSPECTVTTVAGTAKSRAAWTNWPQRPILSPYFPGRRRKWQCLCRRYLQHTIRKIDTSGTVTTLRKCGRQGYFDATGTAARFNFPTGLSADPAGDIYAPMPPMRSFGKSPRPAWSPRSPDLPETADRLMAPGPGERFSPRRL